MKLLFDQNISYRIINLLSEYFPDCKQVRTLSLENDKDIEIWNFAKENNFVIVTFDFINLSNLYGLPPKVIWLKIGNNTTNSIANYLFNHQKL